MKKIYLYNISQVQRNLAVIGSVNSTLPQSGKHRGVKWFVEFWEWNNISSLNHNSKNKPNKQKRVLTMYQALCFLQENENMNNSSQYFFFSFQTSNFPKEQE